MSVEPSQPLAAAADSKESRTNHAAVPIWLIVLTSLLLYWGALYFDQHGGWFNPKVYAPYQSIAELQKYQPKREGPDLDRGRAVFELTCALCHGTDGAGKPGQAPALDESDWVIGSPDRLIRIPLYGLNGPITVKGTEWNMSMAAMGAALSEEDVAAALTYIRQAWSNKAEPITAEQVKAVKAEVGNRSQPFTAVDLNAIP